MTFNVTGQEVAPGVYDPITMFYIVGIILFVGFIVGTIYMLVHR